jgi:hypothetical protein
LPFSSHAGSAPHESKSVARAIACVMAAQPDLLASPSAPRPGTAAPPPENRAANVDALSGAVSMTNPPPAVRWIVTPDTSRRISTAEGIDIGPGTTASGASRYSSPAATTASISLSAPSSSGARSVRERKATPVKLRTQRIDGWRRPVRVEISIDAMLPTGVTGRRKWQPNAADLGNRGRLSPPLGR